MNVVVDVESDGPCPGLYSMISLGAVVADGGFRRTFRAEFAPISDKYDPEALAVSGVTRYRHEKFPHPSRGICDFRDWLNGLREPAYPDEYTPRLTMWSDNNGFDWQWVNYYFHLFPNGLTGRDVNPLGWSSRRIGDYYCGLVENPRANKEWKMRYRRTAHDHDPLNDAKGNAEALFQILRESKFK